MNFDFEWKTFAIIYCLLIDAFETLESETSTSGIRSVRLNDHYTDTQTPKRNSTSNSRKKRKTNHTKKSKPKEKKIHFHTRSIAIFRINSTKIYMANQLTDLRNECSTHSFRFRSPLCVRLFYSHSLSFSTRFFIGIFHVFMCIALCARKASNSELNGRNLNNK